MSLSACGKDKPKETEPTSLEVIEPETNTEETLRDKLEDTSKSLEIHGVAVSPDGRQVSDEEMAAIEESILAQGDTTKIEGQTSDNNNASTGESDSALNKENDSENKSESTGDNGNNTVSDNSEQSNLESLTDDVKRDFTDEEYQEIQDSIDEWTLKEAQELIVPLD